MVSVGIVGNLLDYPFLDPIAALIVGFMVAKMGRSFGWRIWSVRLHDLMDRAVNEKEAAAIRKTVAETPGVKNVHDIRTRKMGDA